jgi:small basic protein
MLSQESFVTASVFPLPRDAEVQSRIHRIRTFSRKARSTCAVLIAFVLISFAIAIFGVLRAHLTTPLAGSVGVFGFPISPITPLPLKVCAMLGAGLGIGLLLAILLQLHRLFGNLANGAIHTSENVRRVRQVGVLWILGAVLGIAIPATVVIVNGLLAAPFPLDLDRVFPSFWEMFTSFSAAGMILLVSWILDVGLYEKQHADSLRRDADLVI